MHQYMLIFNRLFRFSLRILEDTITKGNKYLKSVVVFGIVNMSELAATQAKIDIGLSKKRSVETKIDELSAIERKLQRK